MQTNGYKFETRNTSTLWRYSRCVERWARFVGWWCCLCVRTMVFGTEFRPRHCYNRTHKCSQKLLLSNFPMLGTSLFRRTGTCCTEEMAEQGHHPSLLQSGRRPTVCRPDLSGLVVARLTAVRKMHSWALPLLYAAFRTAWAPYAMPTVHLNDHCVLLE